MRTSRTFTLVLVSVAALSAQSIPPSDVTTIAQTAAKASVVIVTSDSSGKPLMQGSGFLVSKDGKPRPPKPDANQIAFRVLTEATRQH